MVLVARLFVIPAVMALTLSGVATAATFAVDPAHSYLAFRIGHTGVSRVLGRFNNFAGTFTTDDVTGALQGVSIVAQATSVDTAIARRDNHLRSVDFFNVAQFPTIKFASSSVRALDDGRFELSGDLTLHGVTKAVTLVIAQIGAATDAAGATTKLGAEGGFAVKRSDFGMTGLLDTVGDNVEMMIGFEASKQ